MTEEKGKSEAIYRAYDLYQKILKKGDYGHCNECGWKIFSSQTPEKQGLSKSRFVEVCTGFDESEKPIQGTECLLIKHLRYIGEIKSS